MSLFITQISNIYIKSKSITILKHTNKPVFIYLIGIVGTENDIVKKIKIGHTINLKERLSRHSCSNPDKLYYIWTMEHENSILCETFMKKLIKNKNINCAGGTEWFLTCDVQKIIDIIIKILCCCADKKYCDNLIDNYNDNYNDVKNVKNNLKKYKNDNILKYKKRWYV